MQYELSTLLSSSPSLVKFMLLNFSILWTIVYFFCLLLVVIVLFVVLRVTSSHYPFVIFIFSYVYCSTGECVLIKLWCVDQEYADSGIFLEEELLNATLINIDHFNNLLSTLELCPNISALKMETQESSIQFINNIIC